MDEELQERFQNYEREIRQIQEQMNAIDQAVVDMGKVSFGLDELKGKKDAEIFAPVGRGIFIPAKILSDELTVDIGEGNFVKKTIPETKAVIKEQMDKLRAMRNDLESELEKISAEITKAMEESKIKSSEKND